MRHLFGIVYAALLAPVWAGDIGWPPVEARSRAEADDLLTPDMRAGGETHRAYEVYAHGLRSEWGYGAFGISGQTNFCAVVPPRGGHRLGAPLVVLLHSAGCLVSNRCVRGTGLNHMTAMFKKGDYGIYSVPDDVYALFPDCGVLAGADWWWGAERVKGLDLSPCERRVMDEIEWAVGKYGIDRNRIYLAGNSMGGSGTLGIGLRHGDVFAAVKANVPAGVDHVAARMGFGLDPSRTPRFPDPPVAIDYSAPNDTWSSGHERLLAEMEARKYAFHCYWGEFGHSSVNAKVMPYNDLCNGIAWLNIRKDEAYPAFTGASTDNPSPWPCDPKASGRPAGQINGYFRWKNRVDASDRFEMDLWLVSAAEAASKIFTVPTESTADVTLRRLQRFSPAPGEEIVWSFGTTNGTAVADDSGHVTIPRLRITSDVRRLTVTKVMAKKGLNRGGIGVRVFSDEPFGTAQWIAAREGRACNPAFRRDFAVAAPVKKAELNICGLGYQVSSVNGRRVGESELDPVPSDYRRRVYYSTYDVTPLVRVGTNRLEVLLGHGWYDFVERDNWDFDKAGWRDRPKLIAALTLVYGDGRRETVATDSSWRRIGSPVRYDAVRSGIEETGPVEEIDDPVDVTTGPTGRLMKTDCPPTKVRRTLSAVRSRDLGRGAWLFDFGEAIAGRVRLRMRGLSRGDLVKVRYDERVNDDFTPTTNRVIDTYFKDATRELQTDCHQASGLPEEEFAPRFTYKGFRYVLVTGAKAPIRAEDIRAEELQTAFRTTGSFVCSDEDFNELLRMADRSYRANFVNGVPTDCPQREKNGWLGDANLAGEFAAYVYDNHAATRKWLRDIVDAQRPTGEIPGIAPTDTWGFKRYGGTTDETLVHLAGLRARFTGDRSVLSELYPAIVRNLDFRLANHVRSNGTVDEGIGDWCPAKSRTDNTFVSSALFYGAIRKTAAAARLLGKAEDAARFEARAEQMKEAVNRVCYKGSGVYANGTQTAQALALFHGFVPASDREQALAALVRAIHAADDHVDFGIVGASTVFRVLSENGLTDLAYKMIVRPTEPGFLSWRNRGGTCLWEDFDDGFSRCHVMFADFVAWAYAYLAGIRGIEDGYARFVLAPQPIAALDHVTAKVETPRGSVTSAWRREGDRIRYRFTVPDGARAILRLPGRRDECVGGGEYER